MSLLKYCYWKTTKAEDKVSGERDCCDNLPCLDACIVP
jgi:hypothetical protein